MKKIMMVSVNGKVLHHPKWCQHDRMYEVEVGGRYMSQGEADDNHKFVQRCPDCGHDKELDGSELPG